MPEQTVLRVSDVPTSLRAPSGLRDMHARPCIVVALLRLSSASCLSRSRLHACIDDSDSIVEHEEQQRTTQFETAVENRDIRHTNRKHLPSDSEQRSVKSGGGFMPGYDGSHHVGGFSRRGCHVLRFQDLQWRIQPVGCWCCTQRALTLFSNVAIISITFGFHAAALLALLSSRSFQTSES